MLCSAMARARLAMTTASATRSRRSTRMTTSAASDEALAPRAPMAMPTSAAASAGRVVDAVADHQRRAQALLGRDRIDLVGRHAVGEDGVEVEGGADGLGGVGAIPGDHDDPRYAGLAKGLHRARRFPPQFVAEQQRAHRASVDRHEYAQRRAPGGPPQHVHRPLFRLARAVDQFVGADADLAVPDPALQSGPHGFPRVMGHLDGEPSRAARPRRWPRRRCDGTPAPASRRGGAPRRRFPPARSRRR